MKELKARLSSILPKEGGYALIVSLLGYLVDQYDLGLFAITRVASLTSMGLGESDILSNGIFLLNTQMLGMLTGGIVGGILSDKYGRVHILYSSMLLYAIGNIANSFISSVPMYALCRFVAGLGLAAEMGACITIIAESFQPNYRIYGMVLLIALGHVGGIMAAVIAPRLPWRMSYGFGGVLGLGLFLLRLRAGESHLYEKTKKSGVALGDLHRLLSNFKNFSKYARGILAGLPVYYVSGILLAFAPEIGKAIGIVEPIKASIYFAVYYVGIVLGDLSSGIFSYRLKSLKKALFGYQLLVALFTGFYFIGGGIHVYWFYTTIGFLGFASGHWVLINTLAAEQFGTNVRASVATTTPNFVRASIFLMNILFATLKNIAGVKTSAMILGAGILFLSLSSILTLKETYGSDLDFVERY